MPVDAFPRDEGYDEGAVLHVDIRSSSRFSSIVTLADLAESWRRLIWAEVMFFTAG